MLTMVPVVPSMASRMLVARSSTARANAGIELGSRRDAGLGSTWAVLEGQIAIVRETTTHEKTDGAAPAAL
jgi:hypothetical protein